MIAYMLLFTEKYFTIFWIVMVEDLTVAAKKLLVADAILKNLLFFVVLQLQNIDCSELQDVLETVLFVVQFEHLDRKCSIVCSSF